MKKYENGSATRTLILDVSFRLFLEKGFYETSFDDICREAHVNRGSIYYHFKEKENIRYEALWQLITQNRNFAKQYCPGTKYDIILAIYILWKQFLDNDMVRKFLLDYFNDQPAYSPRCALGRFYRTLYTKMYEEIWAFDQINDLDFAAFYGYLHGLMHLIEANLSQYNAEAVFWHSFYAGTTSAYRIPLQKVEKIQAYLSEKIDVLSKYEYDPIVKVHPYDKESTSAT